VRASFAQQNARDAAAEKLEEMRTRILIA